MPVMLKMVFFHEMDWHKHEDIMQVHVQATLKLSYAALNVMAANGNGSIINVPSVASFLPTPSSPLYGPHQDIHPQSE